MSALSTLFDQLLALPPEQHAAFLDTLDPAIADSLRELLAADEAAAELSRAGQSPDAAAVLGHVALDDHLQKRREAELNEAGFQVIRLLGRGGMGEVWLVERAVAGGSQKLALKLLQPGRQEPALLARFRAEQRILLELDHPGIARLVDAGELADSRPWLAMEYVDGPDLLAYADRERLSVKQRLQLFQQVCAAVQYAHDRLIVHRDLKPANMLVDSHGSPKLLDFGIAKILGDTGAAQLAVQTGTAQTLFSLYGVAPEQLQGQRATVATDVYALGTLLYELVCGQRAHRFEGLGFAAIEKQVLHAIPDAPSARLRTAPAAELQVIAQARATTPEGLRRQLGDELDRIVLHALRKAPSERYASARELSADLQRLLDQQPVLAVGQGRGYRLRKFLKRQRWAVAGVVLAIAAVIGFVLRVQAERDAAIKARNSAEQVSQFMVGLFKVADPESPTHDPDIKASELLVQALKKVEIEGLASDPDVGGPLLVALAQAANGLGNLEREKEILYAARMALQGRSGIVVDELDLMEVERLVRTDRSARDFPLLTSLERRLLNQDLSIRATLARVRLLSRADKFEPALRTLRDARVRWKDHRIEWTYARLLTESGEFASAERILRSLIESTREDDRLFLHHASALSALASLLGRRGLHDQAIPLLEQASSVLRSELPPDHPRITSERNNLAAAHGRSGDFVLSSEVGLEQIKLLSDTALQTEPTNWTLQGNFIQSVSQLGPGRPDLETAAIDAAARLRPLGMRFAQWGFAMVHAVPILERQGKIQEALDLIAYALSPGEGKFELSTPRRQSFQAWAEILRGEVSKARASFWLRSEIPDPSRLRDRLLAIRAEALAD